jgi:2-polyprenyl-3-methyl-5-hydroxy-6-metoxy-1,4-benzoquinol methylase
MTGRLSEKQYWDSVLRGAALPRVNSREVHAYRITMDFVDEFLRPRSGGTLLEVGCGASGWLPYFATEYGLLVSGIDYSEVGCRLAEENLQMLRIAYGKVLCTDLFAWDGDDTYDVVFSYGVIEHFENPEEVLMVFARHLRPGGILISLVPNSQGFVGFLSRFFVEKVYRMHRVISREQLRALHARAGLIDVKTAYAGTLSLAVVPWSKSERWIFTPGTLRGTMALRVVWHIEQLLSALQKFGRLHFTSRLFSPYVISIATKKETS